MTGNNKTIRLGGLHEHTETGQMMYVYHSSFDDDIVELADPDAYYGILSRGPVGFHDAWMGTVAEFWAQWKDAK